MATNFYTDSFSQQSEQRLIDELTQETIKFNGIDVFYSPRTLIAEDKLLGEDVLSAFNDAWEIEMYIDDPNTFGGEGDLVARFGLEIRDDVDLTVSRTRFQDVTGLTKPKEGDLIFFPLSKGLFEIKFVEDEAPFYPLGALHTYKLNCQLFEFSQEDFDTGVVAIDDIETDFVNDDDESNDPFADNQVIQEEADTGVTDFSESNPFSEGNF